MTTVTANPDPPDTRNADEDRAESWDEVMQAFAPMRAAHERYIEAKKEAGAFEIEAHWPHEHHRSKDEGCDHTYPNGISASGCCEEDLPCGYVHDDPSKLLVEVRPSGAWVEVENGESICCRYVFDRADRKHVEWIEDPEGDWFSKSDPSKKWRKGKVTWSIRNDSKFCSNACRQRAYRERKKSHAA